MAMGKGMTRERHNHSVYTVMLAVFAQFYSDSNTPIPISSGSQVYCHIIGKKERAVGPFRYGCTDAGRVKRPGIDRSAMTAKPSDKKRGLGHISTL
eukprot:COSAG02_NODE_2996_length_7581_cov_35.324111_3_plen_96_part_00